MAHPLYPLRRGRRYRFELKSEPGVVYDRRDYRGWRRDEDDVLHQFGTGAARLFVDDRDLASVTNLGEVPIRRDARARWEPAP